MYGNNRRLGLPQLGGGGAQSPFQVQPQNTRMQPQQPFNPGMQSPFQVPAGGRMNPGLGMPGGGAQGPFMGGPGGNIPLPGAGAPPGMVSDPTRTGGIRPWDAPGFDPTHGGPFYKPAPQSPGGMTPQPIGSPDNGMGSLYGGQSGQTAFKPDPYFGTPDGNGGWTGGPQYSGMPSSLPGQGQAGQFSANPDMQTLLQHPMIQGLLQQIMGQSGLSQQQGSMLPAMGSQGPSMGPSMGSQSGMSQSGYFGQPQPAPQLTLGGLAGIGQPMSPQGRGSY